MGAVEVCKPEQLVGLFDLIIPGGKSTSMGKLAEKSKQAREYTFLFPTTILF